MPKKHWIMALVAAIGCLALVVVVFGGAALLVSAAFRMNVGPGDPAPAVLFTELDGTELQLQSLQGKVVLLDFWASW